jgi:hypothetical protein
MFSTQGFTLIVNDGRDVFIDNADPNVDGNVVNIRIPSITNKKRSIGIMIVYILYDFSIMLRVGSHVSFV